MSARVVNGEVGTVMIGDRKAKAHDIPDAVLLRAIDQISRTPWPINGTPNDGTRWVMRWDLSEVFPAVPAKLMVAKCARLVGRGLLTGCTCGCRGDFELTDAGRKVAAESVL